MSDSGNESAVVSAPPTEVAPVELASADSVVTYLRKLATVILEDGSGGSTLSSLDSCLRDATTVEAIKRFISDHQSPVLVLERIPTVRDEDGEMSSTESELETENATYNLSTEVHFSSQKASSILLIKRSHAIEADKPIVQQVRMISLTEGNPYETLHSYVSSAVAPYFKSYIRESGRGDSYRDGDKLAPSVEKKLSELEIGLLHLQQNIEIPEIHLPAHPIVQAVIKKAAEENRKPKVGDLSDRVEDSSFLNQLQNGVNRWIREIQKVTKLDRDPASGTAIQEITFWLNLERALLKLYQKRESDEVTLTLEALKHGKRFHATVSFDTDTGLKQAMTTVNDYNVLMKDFPLNDLLSATELDKIRSALLAIFAHLRKIRNTKYPIQRALRLVEAISRDLQGQMLKVLNTRRLMHIPIADFDKLMNSCFEVFSAWDDEYDKLSALMRDISKKKREEQMKLTWRITPPHKKLQARLEQMRKFRRAHEQLRTVISRVLRPAASKSSDMEKSIADLSLEPAPLDSADANAIEEVNVAYENVKEVDCLDLSKEGTDAWEAALRRYEERIDRVEARITSRLRDQLGGAKNANEMFLIFSRFNALFIRPHIRGAIREYQAQLILRVKEDIESLQRQFTVHYVDSTASNMSQARDLPPVSGSIIWIKQIDRQLSTYMKRIEDVLGRGWENHVEGRQLKQEGDNFRLKLNTQHIFDDWVAKVQARNLAIAGKVYVIEAVRRSNDGKSILRLRVNFSPEVITLSKEVRNLKNMGFRIPLPVVNKAHQANQLYPFAISLLESVRTYDSINDKIADKRDMVLLVAGHKRDIQSQIAEGGGLVWESYKMDPYVKKFAETINQYQEKVEELLVVQDAIDAQLAAMDTCQYAAPTIAALLATIQKAVDQLSLGNYSNLHIWVQKLDEEIEKKLARRLQEGVRAWTRVLEGRNDQEDLDSTDHSPDQAKVKAGGEPVIQTMVHEMRLTSQVMYLSPTIEEARSNLLQQLFAWEAIITTQQRISSTRYQVAIDRNTSESTYRNLLSKLPEGQGVIEQAYTAVENLLSKVREYVGEWLRYQALWDLQPDMLYERLGTDLNKWMKTLVEIKKSRNTFDTQETRKEIPPLIVDYAKVQSKVSLKYDNWHREVLQKYGGALGVEMQTFFTDVSKSRNELEQQSVDAGTTSEAVGFITYVQGLKKQTKQWQDQVEMFREGQRLLSFQRFQFPTNWLYADNIEGEWSAFSDILGRKDSAIQTQ
uniref:Dynein heavy chain tail domain-containing protein n=1 Tax=Plectus sambesii TaxID=2011161 RepID=A0A914WGW8_9BILA